MPSLLQLLIDKALVVDLSKIDGWVLVPGTKEAVEAETPMLSMILSPTCPACIHYYPEILHFATGRLPLQILLLPKAGEEAAAHWVCSRILSYVQQQQNDRAFAALTYWFDLAKAERSTRSWFAQYPALEDGEEAKYVGKISGIRELLDRQNVTAFPSLMLGDRSVSLEFGIETAMAVMRKLLAC